MCRILILADIRPMTFLAVVVLGLGKKLLFKSILGCWETFDKGFLTAICRGIRNLRIYFKKEKEDAFNRKFFKSQIYPEKKVQRLLLYLGKSTINVLLAYLLR